jgi:hypothetical protein
MQPKLPKKSRITITLMRRAVMGVPPLLQMTGDGLLIPDNRVTDARSTIQDAGHTTSDTGFLAGPKPATFLVPTRTLRTGIRKAETLSSIHHENSTEYRKKEGARGGVCQGIIRRHGER